MNSFKQIRINHDMTENKRNLTKQKIEEARQKTLELQQNSSLKSIEKDYIFCLRTSLGSRNNKNKKEETTNQPKQPLIKNIKISTLNCQSLRNKVYSIMESIVSHKIDHCFLQETFLKDNDSPLLKEITEFGFKIFSFPRKNGRQHGGLAVIYCPDYNLITHKSYLNSLALKYKSFEY